MVFVKGYIQSAEQKARIKETRHKKYGSAICVGCGKVFSKYTRAAKTCGKTQCLQARSNQDYRHLVDTDPFNGKALKLFSTIRLGKGKQKLARKILRKFLGESCKYCGVEITLENASVDHKIPRQGSKVYSRRTKKMAYSYSEIRELDKASNLQIICRPCNGLKGEFTDDEYSRLLVFLSAHPDIKKTLTKRLKIGFLAFR